LGCGVFERRFAMVLLWSKHSWYTV